MPYNKWYAVPLTTAARDYGVNKRTLTRWLEKWLISKSQTFLKDGQRHIYIAELIRVYGEPKNRPETDTAGGAPATKAGNVTDGAEVVAILREQLAKAEALASSERERADKLLTQFIEATTTIRLLTVGNREEPPAVAAPKGWFGWFR